MENNVENSWNTLYVIPRSEKKVAARLEDLGIEQYLPLKTTRKRWKNREIKRQLPLIPCYVFAKIPEKMRYMVENIQSVNCIVRFNQKPAIIKDYEIENLRLIEKYGDKYNIHPCHSYKLGETLTFEKGPFQGLTGIISEFRGKHRIIIQIESLRYCLAIEECSQLHPQRSEEKELAIK